MNEEQNIPFLTLEPEPEEKKEPEVVPVPPAPSPSVKEPNLTPEEQKMVDDFVGCVLFNWTSPLRYIRGSWTSRTRKGLQITSKSFQN